MTERELVEKYCAAWNLLNADISEPHLDDAVTYDSQVVLDSLVGKEAVLNYFRGKMKTIRKNPNLFAELAFCGSQRGMTVKVATTEGRPCVLLAQPSKEEVLALILLEVKDSKIKGACLCTIAPNPDAAIRTGYYPGLDESWAEWPDVVEQ